MYDKNEYGVIKYIKWVLYDGDMIWYEWWNIRYDKNVW